MRIKKRKQPGMPPVQVEALGEVAHADLMHVPNWRGIGAGTVAAAQPRAGRGAGKTPLLIGGESPLKPYPGKSPEFLGYSESVVLDRNQNPVIRPGVRCIKGQKVGIDWVSCVFHPSQTWAYDFIASIYGVEENLTDDVKTAQSVKGIISWILGLDKNDQSGKWSEFKNGLNGYHYALGMPYRAGVIHVGHSSGTVLVTISGQGAMVAASGWEVRLYRFLSDVKGWLTRIDMAFDDFEGKYFPVRAMRERAKEGAFARGGRPPKIELRGAWDQDDPTNSGLTLYVGARMSGKFTRIYEKGKQLGDEQSPWVRAEVELHNSCYQLLLDMLLHPTRWYVAFYPCFEIVETSGDRSELDYRKNVACYTLERSLKWIRHQAGGHLAVLRQFYSDTELLDLLQRPDGIPESFIVANKACENILSPSACLTDEPAFIEA